MLWADYRLDAHVNTHNIVTIYQRFEAHVIIPRYDNQAWKNTTSLAYRNTKENLSHLI
jgi:hypothetical protein